MDVFGASPKKLSDLNLSKRDTAFSCYVSIWFYEPDCQTILDIFLKLLFSVTLVPGQKRTGYITSVL
jgi:hypothetical protein